MQRCTRHPTEYSSSLFCGRLFSCRPLLLLLPLFLTRCLLLGDRRTARPLAGARVRMSALAAHRKSAPMAQSAIRTDVHQTFDVHLNALPQVALDLSLSLEDRANTAQLVFAQVTHASIQTHLCFIENRGRPRSANAVNICKTDLSALIRRKIYTCYTSHAFEF